MKRLLRGLTLLAVIACTEGIVEPVDCSKEPVTITFNQAESRFYIDYGCGQHAECNWPQFMTPDFNFALLICIPNIDNTTKGS
jgi:hypothetical protein